LETFGCQMNVHDSEKVAGVLLQRGYRSVEDPAQADLVLYNTCSIREKAAQKVFARLGDWKTLSNGKIIGVLGCLAQQEGEEIFERAPWVSLVCGSASYRRLPELVAELEAGGLRVIGLDRSALTSPSSKAAIIPVPIASSRTRAARNEAGRANRFSRTSGASPIGVTRKFSFSAKRSILTAIRPRAA
jgi:tRNA A37 methylthiotransferase MiaB